MSGEESLSKSLQASDLAIALHMPHPAKQRSLRLSRRPAVGAIRSPAIMLPRRLASPLGPPPVTAAASLGRPTAARLSKHPSCPVAAAGIDLGTCFRSV